MCSSDLLSKAITFVSLISYSLYLLHASFVRDAVIFGVIRSLPAKYTPGAAMYLAYWVMSLAAAYLMYRFVETPFMRMREQRSPDLPPASLPGHGPSYVR